MNEKKKEALRKKDEEIALSFQTKSKKPRKGLYNDLYLRETKTFTVYKKEKQTMRKLPKSSGIENARNKSNCIKTTVKKPSTLTVYKGLIKAFKDVAVTPRNGITAILNKKQSNKVIGVNSSKKPQRKVIPLTNLKKQQAEIKNEQDFPDELEANMPYKFNY